MDIQELKNLLRKHRFRPNPAYGQNFLIDDKVLSDLLEAADISAGDAVLEIGPGIGNLTRALCGRAGFVLSIEKDRKFLPLLIKLKKAHPNNFRFEIADVLEYNFQRVFAAFPSLSKTRGTLKKGYKVVANIPYFITGKILEMLMSAKFKPESITLLIQKEVAERIAAGPGDLSILAVSVRVSGQPKIVRLVPASAFYPEPKVDSAILKIALYPQPKYEIADERKFFQILKACFAGKRKQIHNLLEKNLRWEKSRVAQILASLNLDPKCRPQELTIEQWASLVQKIQ